MKGRLPTVRQDELAHTYDELHDGYSPIRGQQIGQTGLCRVAQRELFSGCRKCEKPKAFYEDHDQERQRAYVEIDELILDHSYLSHQLSAASARSV